MSAVAGTPASESPQAWVSTGVPPILTVTMTALRSWSATAASIRRRTPSAASRVSTQASPRATLPSRQGAAAGAGTVARIRTVATSAGSRRAVAGSFHQFIAMLPRPLVPCRGRRR